MGLPEARHRPRLPSSPVVGRAGRAPSGHWWGAGGWGAKARASSLGLRHPLAPTFQVRTGALGGCLSWREPRPAPLYWCWELGRLFCHPRLGHGDTAVALWWVTRAKRGGGRHWAGTCCGRRCRDLGSQPECDRGGALRGRREGWGQGGWAGPRGPSGPRGQRGARSGRGGHVRGF